MLKFAVRISKKGIARDATPKISSPGKARSPHARSTAFQMMQLQKTIGNRAVTQMIGNGALQLNDNPNKSGGIHRGEINNLAQGVIQRASFEDKGSDTVQTPAGAISKALKLPVNQMTLPGSQPANDLPRAKKVEAIVDSSTLRDKERGKSGNLSKTTTMARGEQFILQGADVKKFYDAGHLVADQLAGGTYDTFEMWNLAPQASDFNAPTYAQIMEEEIKGVAKKEEVKLTVETGYPNGGSYNVKVSDVIGQGILPAKELNSTNVQIGSKSFNKTVLDKVINIPRRIPDTWKMTAQVNSGKTLPATQKPAGRGELGENFTSDLSSATPTIGTPFHFNVSSTVKDQNLLKLTQSQTRVFEARQWTPALAGVRKEDIVSLVATTFPALKNKADIINSLSEPDVEKEKELFTQALLQASVIQNDIMGLYIKVKDKESLNSLANAYYEKIKLTLENAKKQITLADALKEVLHAISNAEDFKEILEKKIEEEQQVSTLTISPLNFGSISSSPQLSLNQSFGQTVPSMNVPKKKLMKSRSQRAGLVFPVGRTHRNLKKHIKSGRVTPGASVYMAAVLEYLVAEMMELSGSASKQTNRQRITPRHLQLVLKHDEELGKLVKDVTKTDDVDKAFEKLNEK